MVFARIALTISAMAICTSCTTDAVSQPAPATGASTVIRSTIDGLPGREAIVTDVVMPPNGTIPPHYHPAQEFLYVVDGSLLHVERGQDDRWLNAGDAYVIPTGATHAPRAGPHEARAIVFRVHPIGEPVRLSVEE